MARWSSCFSPCQEKEPLVQTLDYSEDMDGKQTPLRKLADDKRPMLAQAPAAPERAPAAADL